MNINKNHPMQKYSAAFEKACDWAITSGHLELCLSAHRQGSLAIQKEGGLNPPVPAGGPLSAQVEITKREDEELLHWFEQIPSKVLNQNNASSFHNKIRGVSSFLFGASWSRWLLLSLQPQMNPQVFDQMLENGLSYLAQNQDEVLQYWSPEEDDLSLLSSLSYVQALEDHGQGALMMSDQYGIPEGIRQEVLRAKKNTSDSLREVDLRAISLVDFIKLKVQKGVAATGYSETVWIEKAKECTAMIQGLPESYKKALCADFKMMIPLAVQSGHLRASEKMLDVLRIMDPDIASRCALEQLIVGCEAYEAVQKEKDHLQFVKHMNQLHVEQGRQDLVEPEPPMTLKDSHIHDERVLKSWIPFISPLEFQENTVLEGNETALMAVSRTGCSFLIDPLLEHGANPHLQLTSLKTNYHACNPLMVAIIHQKIDCVKRLLKVSHVEIATVPNSDPEDENTALKLAIKSKNYALVELVKKHLEQHEKGMEIYALELGSHFWNRETYNALGLILKLGHLHLVPLFDETAQWQWCGSKGRSAIHLALDGFEDLLEKKQYHQRSGGEPDLKMIATIEASIEAFRKQMPHWVDQTLKALLPDQVNLSLLLSQCLRHDLLDCAEIIWKKAPKALMKPQYYLEPSESVAWLDDPLTIAAQKGLVHWIERLKDDPHWKKLRLPQQDTPLHQLIDSDHYQEALSYLNAVDLCTPSLKGLDPLALATEKMTRLLKFDDHWINVKGLPQPTNSIKPQTDFKCLTEETQHAMKEWADLVKAAVPQLPSDYDASSLLSFSIRWKQEEVAEALWHANLTVRPVKKWDIKFDEHYHQDIEYYYCPLSMAIMTEQLQWVDRLMPLYQTRTPSSSDFEHALLPFPINIALDADSDLVLDYLYQQHPEYSPIKSAEEWNALAYQTFQYTSPRCQQYALKHFKVPDAISNAKGPSDSVLKTALIWAAAHMSLEVLQTLWNPQNALDVDSFGINAFVHAGDLPKMKWLFETGFYDLSMLDNAGRTVVNVLMDTMQTCDSEKEASPHEESLIYVLTQLKRAGFEEAQKNYASEVMPFEDEDAPQKVGFMRTLFDKALALRESAELDTVLTDAHANQQELKGSSKSSSTSKAKRKASL